MEDKIRQISQEIYDRNSAQDQFAVSTTSFHTHNGSDAPKVPFLNLADVPSSYYQQKGHSVIVDSSEGLLRFSGGVLPLTSTDGFITFPTCAGTPTGVPSAGNGASIYDTTANKLWIYNGGWKFVALA